MKRRIRILFIFVLVDFVALALLFYKTYQSSSNYVSQVEFVEQNDENTNEDTIEDDSSPSAITLSVIIDNSISLTNTRYVAEEKSSSVEVSEELEASSSNSETEKEDIEIIEPTLFYCDAKNYLNIHDTPSVDSEILGTVARAESLEVYGYVTLDSEEIWAEISYNGITGFVSEKYLSDEPVSEYSQSEIYLFAQILYAEAGACDKAEMARVGQVVLNRINTDYSEFQCCTSIYSALYHTGAYPDTVEKIENGLVPSEEALQVAEGLLEGTLESGLSTNVLWQTGFEPSWEVTIVYVSNWGHYYSTLAS